MPENRGEGDSLDPSLHHLMVLERVTLDTTVLVGSRSLEFAVAAHLGLYRGHWSNWIVSEFTRVRTELILRRASRELGLDKQREDDASMIGEIERRLLRSRAKVNAAVDEFSRVLTSVDYHRAAGADLGWLKDADDKPIMQTAIAAGTPGVLVSDNKTDFPIGEIRNRILIVSSELFLQYLYDTFPDHRTVIAKLAENRRRGLREAR